MMAILVQIGLKKVVIEKSENIGYYMRY
ncbi:hypothetical protein Godav_013710 [Gossypium davidsonii]|uniref:Uncharacterized protein n=1 Tax=Gossypium davidsonii TaxID=34287 RepID=A0A7J8RHB0_GOSDV|nr:hypothetical protein [Gossypium davidsonii]